MDTFGIEREDVPRGPARIHEAFTCIPQSCFVFLSPVEARYSRMVRGGRTQICEEKRLATWSLTLALRFKGYKHSIDLG